MPNKSAALPQPSADLTSLAHITADNLSLKFAEDESDVIAAQELRYKVFYQELGAHPIKDMARLERDYDEYDTICDHLLVIDNAAPNGEQIVGTYRALMLDTAQANHIPLYCETEFDFSKLKATGGRIMEVSRSCVLPSYRSRAAINLLWKGIAACVRARNIDYLIGAPSLPGVDPATEREALAYLNAFHLAPDNIRPHVLEEFYHPLPQIDKDTIDAKRVFMSLPPLLKGYLRLGAVVSDGVFIDRQFNCMDTGIIVEFAKISERYLDRYLGKNA